MELTIVNQTQLEEWNQYEQDFFMIAEKTENVLQLKEVYSACIIFLKEEDIHKLNKEYRNIDKPTDVISFALRDQEDNYEKLDGENELGDIFINIQAVISQAQEYGHSIRREVCFLFTHGLLHLLGYDHMCEEDEKEMFQLQDVILDDIVSKKI